MFRPRMSDDEIDAAAIFVAIACALVVVYLIVR